MPIHFITSSDHKFKEISAIVPGLERLQLDLPELQEIDPKIIIRAKLKEATAHHLGEFIVEDTSLHLDCLGGLPGPLIKWFKQAMGLPAIADLAAKLGNDRATARTIIGYAHGHDDICFFEGVRNVRIVPPRGQSNFGWDVIFMPEGEIRTQGEMTTAEKNAVSMRGEAARKLKEFLDKR